MKAEAEGADGSPARDGKAPKKIVSLPSDPNRGLVNIHHILSYKEYNA